MTDELRTEDATPEPNPNITEATATAEADLPAEENGENKPEKLVQQVDFTDIGPCKKHIRVAIERSVVDKLLEEKFKDLVTDRQVVIPGFRPGKAPRKVIERRFRKEVHDQVKASLLLQSLEQLAEEHDVAPISPPNIDPNSLEIPNEGPFIYEFDVEVRPQFDLPNYKGLKFKRPMKTFTDKDIDRELRRLLEPYGQLMPKPPAEGGVQPTADEGDIIFADVLTRFGDRVLSDLKEIKIRVEPRLAFKDGVAPKFLEQIRGAKAGDTRVVDITLSDAVADSALRNQTVQATVTVKEVKIVRLPEITHELCHEFGVHSEAQLRELLRLVLERRLHYLQRQSARQQMLQLITAASSWELPQDLLMRQARSAYRRRIVEMQTAGMSEQEINARARLLQQDVLSSTALALKEHFILQKIAEVEKIEVDEDDIQAEIERLAAQQNESPRRIRARLEREGMLESLEIELIERKALDLVLSSAEYEDVPLDQVEEPTLATVEEQTVPGAMQDPTALPSTEEKATEDSQS